MLRPPYARPAPPTRAEQLQKERAEKQKTVSELTIALARIQSELLDSKVKAMTQQKETMVVTLEVAAEI